MKFNRVTIITLGIILCCSLFACSSSKAIQNVAEIDPSWQGTWSGPMLVDNSDSPAKIIELELEFTSTHITGYFTDAQAGIRHKIVSELQFKGNELQFKIAYQTKYILRSYMKFTGSRRGLNMAATFTGRRGGRAFSGKWQARKKIIR